ncbi:hypothetical protein ACIA49_40590 [Kribbella sp. NPDC051587]|uniref:hypothetical protein n=1 Tax=Kribbella sp. NPDC051587 TaxID=3364119 RepID=UPI0037900EC4
MPPKFTRWLEWAPLAILSLAGVATAVADLFGWLDKITSKGVSAITLLLVSGVVVTLLTRLSPLHHLERIRAELDSLDIGASAEARLRDQYGGLTRVHRIFPVDVFEGYVRTAQQVTILNTWIPNLGLLMDELEVAVGRRAEVRILMLHPQSKLVGLRDAALGATPGAAGAAHVSSGVEDCLEQLSELYGGLTKQYRSCLKVKVFDSQASISVYRADDHYLVSMFLHGQLAIETPQFEIEGTTGTVLGRQVQKELKKLWEIGTDVDLGNWRASIEKSDPEPEE